MRNRSKVAFCLLTAVVVLLAVLFLTKNWGSVPFYPVLSLEDMHVDANCSATIERLQTEVVPVNAFCISNDGRKVFVAGGDTIVTIASLDDGQLLGRYFGHSSPLECVAVSPADDIVASGDRWPGGRGGELRVWDAKTGTDKWKSDFWHPVVAVAISPTGQLLAAASGSIVTLWDLRTGRQVRSFDRHTADVISLAFNPNESLLAVGSGARVWLWNLAGAEDLRGVCQANGPLVLDLAFSPNGETLAIAGAMVELWDAVRLTPQAFFEGSFCVAFSSDGELLATGSTTDHKSGRLIRLWDIGSGKIVCTLSGHGSHISEVQFCPRANTVVSIGDELGIWRIETLGSETGKAVTTH